MATLILQLIGLYVAIVLCMVLMQRQMMYKPVAGDVAPAHFELAHFSEIMIDSEDGTPLQLWYHEAKPGLPTVIYFHGNAGHLGMRAAQLAAFVEVGLGVAAVSYRGYGKSKGKPHENGIYADARAAIKWVKQRGIPMTQVAFYGESLGTGVAVRMASEFAPKALFLQAPYMSVASRAAEIYWYVPVRYLLRDRYDSMAHIRNVKAPLLIFHGKRDEVIPVHHAERLLEIANEPKRAIYFEEVGHTEFDPRLIAQHVLEVVK